MLKYYIALFLLAGAVLYYVFLQDPCSGLVKTEFSNKYPDYKILYSGATEGSPDSVHCHVSYQKPDSEQTYEDIWLYRDLGSVGSYSAVSSAPVD